MRVVDLVLACAAAAVLTVALVRWAEGFDASMTPWLAWALLPIGVYALGAWRRDPQRARTAPALAAVRAALVAAYVGLFLAAAADDESSTSALALIWLPLWALLAFGALALLSLLVRATEGFWRGRSVGS